jgi:uroporphyrinogen-III decarboxylase
MIPHWVDFTSIESQARFFGQKFFEADVVNQAIFQAEFFKSDIINLPLAGYPGCYDIFCDRLYEGEDYIISRNPFGGLHYWRKRPYFAKILHSPVQTRKDLESIPQFDLRQFETKMHTYAQHAKALHDHGYFILAEIKGAFEAPWMFLRGLVPYMKDLVKDPEFITRMIEASFKPMMDLAEMAIDQAPVDGVWITDDLGERTNPFLSVDNYRRIYKPWHKQAVDRLHKKGVTVSLHSDGNVMSLVGEFVDVGFDSVDPLDPADNMGLSELKARYGERTTLMGGITRGIGTMTPQEIYQHIQQIVRDAGPYSLILNCGGGIPPEMPLENLMHYFITIEKLRRSSVPSLSGNGSNPAM